MEDKKNNSKQIIDTETDIELDSNQDVDTENSVKDSESDAQSGEISSEELIKDLEDQLLRAKAEVQNVRRIAAQEVTKARLFGIESFARDVISVSDNLERALESSKTEENNQVIEEGLELTLKSLQTALKSSGIEPIDTNEKEFDPEKHEAISLLEDDSLKPNTIIDVVQKGYVIIDRTLRPAKVVVSKKTEEK